MDKHYLSMFYGVDEALPDEEFVRQCERAGKQCPEEKEHQGNCTIFKEELPWQ